MLRHSRVPSASSLRFEYLSVRRPHARSHHTRMLCGHIIEFVFTMRIGFRRGFMQQNEQLLLDFR